MTPKSKPPKIDWDTIRRWYERGSLSNMDIVREYRRIYAGSHQHKNEVAESAIRKRARLQGWSKPTLERGTEAQEAERAKVREGVRTTAESANAQECEGGKCEPQRAIVRRGRERGSAPEVVETHRDTQIRNLPGRPSTYNLETARRICHTIAQGGSVVRLCQENADMPNISTVYDWVRRYPEFATAYALSRQDQADTLADQLQDIADTEEDPAKARVRCDVRKWIAAKLRPARYGDRIDISGEIAHKVAEIRRVIIEDNAAIEGQSATLKSAGNNYADRCK